MAEKWTPMMNDMFRVLRSEKFTAAEIATVMSDVFDREITRNAVLGKAHRMFGGLGYGRTGID